MIYACYTQVKEREKNTAPAAKTVSKKLKKLAENTKAP